MNRRNVLIGAGSIGAATIGLAAFSGGAAAETDAQFTADKITGEADDGVVHTLTVSATGTFAFEGLDSAATGATVTLEARADSDAEFETIDETHVEPPATQAADDVSFDALSGDLLAADQFDSDDFSAGEGDDPEEDTINESEVELRLVTTVEYGDADVTDTPTTTLDVAMTNIGADAETDAEAGGEIGTSYHIGTSPDNPEADVDTEGVLDVRAVYGEEHYTYQVSLDEPWSDDEEEHANLGLGFDVDDSGEWDFQANWSSEEGFFGDDYESFVGEPVDGEKDGADLTFRIPADAIGGDEYLFVANASYGGPTHANVSTDPSEAWSEENDWRSSEYFLTVPVEE